MLTSWHSLLDALAHQAKQDGDTQATFEIAQLQGLVIDVITKGKPKRDEPLKRLIKGAVSRLVQSGWANTDRLSWGHGFGFFVRWLRIAGATAGLGIDYDIVKQRPDRLLWLTFCRDKAASVSLESVRNVLGDLDEQGLKWRRQDISIHIPLPSDADHLETVNAIVFEMERIAKLIDPNGPTYQN